MFEILGYIFVAIIGITILTHIVIGIINLFKDEDPYISVRCSTYAFWITYEGFYVLPTILVNCSRYLSISFRWLGIYFDVDIKITSEDEEASEAQGRRENDKLKTV